MFVRLLQHPTNHDARCLWTDGFTRETRGDSKEPVIRFIGNSSSEDRHGSIIDPLGIDVSAYLRNPVFLWAHNHDLPPIGKALSVDTSKRGTVFSIRYATDISPFAREIFLLTDGGYLNGTSIGFVPIAWTDREAKTIPVEFAENRFYTKTELMELSAAPVPSNRDALKLAYDRRILSEMTIRMAGLGPFIHRSEPYILRFGGDEQLAHRASAALPSQAASTDAVPDDNTNTPSDADRSVTGDPVTSTDDPGDSSTGAEDRAATAAAADATSSDIHRQRTTPRWSP